MRFNVTATDIKKGGGQNYVNNHGCLLYLSIVRRLGRQVGTEDVAVGATFVRLDGVFYPLPRIAVKNALKAARNPSSVKPFKFSLPIPESAIRKNSASKPLYTNQEHSLTMSNSTKREDDGFKKKLFRVHVTFIQEAHYDIEAESKGEAIRIAGETDAIAEEDSQGDFQINYVEDLSTEEGKTTIN